MRYAATVLMIENRDLHVGHVISYNVEIGGCDPDDGDVDDDDDDAPVGADAACGVVGANAARGVVGMAAPYPARP